jgi:hypothetical protein
MESALATLPSNLLPLLFERLPEDRPLEVLDVGSGSGDTLAFFSGLRSRVHFAALYDEAVVRDLQSEATEDVLLEQFRHALSFAKGACFDVCLYWDFLNYLDGPALRAFVEAIRPCVHIGTRSHGFGMLNAKTTLNNNHYGLRRRDLLSYRRRTEQQLPVYPHSQRELNQLLGYFGINKSRLMSDGQLEFILDCEDLHGARAPRKSVYNF